MSVNQARKRKLPRQIEQLELRLDELETAQAEEAAASPTPGAAGGVAEIRRSVRRPLPAHLPREVQEILPKEAAYPDCGGELESLGEDVSEMLEYFPPSFRVIRQVRPKLACSRSDRTVQAEAPSRPIARGLAGPGLLAHVLTSKYCNHLPLYRQAEIYVREGVELERATLAGWIGGASGLLAPLFEVLRRHVTSAEKLHADDTPPAVWFAYSPDRKGEHPVEHLRGFRGVLQADAYAGFNQHYEGAVFRKQPAGRMFEEDSMIFRSRTNRRSPTRRSSGSRPCTLSRMKFAAVRPTSGARSGKLVHGLY